jgi:hypothetical protein
MLTSLIVIHLLKSHMWHYEDFLTLKFWNIDFHHPLWLLLMMLQPYIGQVWGWSATFGKSEDLESSGTPECSELDSKAQNTLHWGVLGVIGKVFKRRYRKWPRIGHLDICSPSYGQKKRRESNWQFDSRPLKVGNQPLPDLRIKIAIRRWKKISTRVTSLVQTSSQPDFAVGSYELPKSRDSTRDNFGTPTRESWEKMTFGRGCRVESQSIL